MACACAASNLGLGGRSTSFGGFSGHAAQTLGVPNAFDSRLSYPLILLLHGKNQTAAALRTFLGLNELKDFGSGAFTISPQGLNDAGQPTWNASSACCWFGGSPPDDVTYLADLVAEISAVWPVDPRFVWVVGYSNGGFMANRVAQERSDVITGIITINGYYSDPAGGGTNPANNVHVTTIGATADTVVVFAGDPDGNTPPTDVPLGPYPGCVATAGFWATNNGTGALAGADYQTLDIDSAVGGSETGCRAYDTPPAGGSVERWTMTGSVHNPTFTTNKNWLVAVQNRLTAYRASPR